MPSEQPDAVTVKVFSCPGSALIEQPVAEPSFEKSAEARPETGSEKVRV